MAVFAVLLALLVFSQAPATAASCEPDFRISAVYHDYVGSGLSSAGRSRRRRAESESAAAFKSLPAFLCHGA